VAPTREGTQSEGETLDFLFVTHFPDSDVVEGGGVPATAHHATRMDCRVAARIITYRRVKWAIVHSPHTKALAWMGFSQLFCKRVGRSLFRT